jgi:hypothetical protein
MVLSDHPTVSRTLGASSLRKSKGKGWIDYYILDVLNVGIQAPHEREFFDVEVKIEDHSGEWKSGMLLDFVELVRV